MIFLLEYTPTPNHDFKKKKKKIISAQSLKYFIVWKKTNMKSIYDIIICAGQRKI